MTLRKGEITRADPAPQIALSADKVRGLKMLTAA
jgi:hypothetical protein